MLEAKAQPISAATGVFLAGVFAYASQLPKNVTSLEKTLLLVVAALLVASIIYSLRAIWVVIISSPHVGSKAIDEVNAILKACETQPEAGLDTRYENLLNDATRTWLTTCEDLDNTLKRKGKLLNKGIVLLAVAATTVFILLIVTTAYRPPLPA